MNLLCFVGSAICFFTAFAAQAQNMGQQKTPSFFDGISNDGFIHFVEHLGEFEVDNCTIPLIAEFKSNDFGHNRLLGVGWAVPILEARIIQEDVNRALLFHPYGIPFALHRVNGEEVFKTHEGKWELVFHKHKAIASGPDQERIIFHNGRIKSYETQNFFLEYIYNRGRLKEVRSNGHNILRIDQVDDSIRVTHKGQSLFVAALDRRTLLDEDGQVLSIKNSLGQLSSPNWAVRDYVYSRSSTGDYALERTTDTGTQRFEWDRRTFFARGVLGWQYEVTQLDDKNISIRRTDADGLEEWYICNRNEGTTRKRVKGEREVVESWFVSPKFLYGKPRSVRDSKGNVRLYRYDENGDLSAIVDNRLEIHYLDGLPTRVIDRGIGLDLRLEDI